jgi:hypothetical protein
MYSFRNNRLLEPVDISVANLILMLVMRWHKHQTRS